MLVKGIILDLVSSNSIDNKLLFLKCMILYVDVFMCRQKQLLLAIVNKWKDKMKNIALNISLGEFTVIILENNVRENIR